jgi:Protein of unknown function (DUF1566)
MKLGRAAALMLSFATASAGLGCESILGLTPGKGLCDGITCPAKDACHLPGTCDEGTGKCSSPVAQDKTPCNDGNPCTTGDACQGGACVPGSPKTCAPPGPCHTASTCDPKTGQCGVPVALNQGPCDDGDACTTGDACQDGACVPGSPKTCAPPAPCHTASTCDPKTGQCGVPVALNQGPCDDGNPCTTGDTCQGGACAPGAPETCAPKGPCRTAGTCDPKSGCSYTDRKDGTVCDDGSECTTGDACQGGECTGAHTTNGSRCGFGDSCTMAGTCINGACVGSKTANDGAACDDGTVCTSNDTCKGGICSPSTDRSLALWDLASTYPSPRYEATDNVVYDRLTHLTWQRVAPVETYAVDKAADYCKSLTLPGYPKGWRLPKRIELTSIVDYTRESPAIDSGYFQGQSLADRFWSSSPAVGLSPSDQWWWISFSTGYIGANTTATPNRVRCVR